MQKSEAETQAFVNHMAGTLASVLLLVVLLAEIIAPLIVMAFAPGFLNDPTRYQLATHMLRVTFPYALLISLTAFSGAILNTCKKFAIPAFTPVLLNLALIIAAVAWAPHASTPIYALAWGVLIAGVMQLLFQLPFLYREKLLPRPKILLKDVGVRRVLKLMVPALFGVSVAQIGLLIDNLFASFLPAGSISWLYYSDRLTYLPLGVIGVALATVVMPYLARQHSAKATADYSNTVDWALRCVVLIGLPAALGLLLLAGPLLSTLFQHQAFTATDVLMARQSLMAFAIGLPGFMLVKILASGYYAQQNIKTPVKIAAIALAANVVLNVILIVPLRHAGLALATSLASMINSALLLIVLVRRGIYQPRSQWWLFLLRIGIANCLMGLLIYFLAGPLSYWTHWSALTRVGHLTMIIALAVVVYVVGLWLTGCRLKHFKPPKSTG